MWENPKRAVTGDVITAKDWNNNVDNTIILKLDTEELQRSIAEAVEKLERLQQTADGETKAGLVAVTAALASTLTESRRKFSRRALLGLSDKDDE